MNWIAAKLLEFVLQIALHIMGLDLLAVHAAPQCVRLPSGETVIWTGIGALGDMLWLGAECLPAPWILPVG